MKTDEQVPTKTPTIRANIKPLIDSPPKVKMANNTIKVVKDVFKKKKKFGHTDLTKDGLFR